MDAIVKFLMNILSRKFEFEADKFAMELGYKKELARSLIKLQVQNLSTMEADWMYASYHYSHPILHERLSELGWVGSGKAVAAKEDEKHGNGRVVEVQDEKDEAKVLKAGDREL